jgi:hypothetical protein
MTPSPYVDALYSPSLALALLAAVKCPRTLSRRFGTEVNDLQLNANNDMRRSNDCSSGNDRLRFFRFKKNVNVSRE